MRSGKLSGRVTDDFASAIPADEAHSIVPPSKTAMSNH